MKPLIYVAGPMTTDPYGCVRRATHAWADLRNIGCTPFLPQLSVLHELVDPQPYATWLDYDLDVIRHCHGLLRLTGQSYGADVEVRHARELGIPVWHEDTPGWLHAIANFAAHFAQEPPRP